MFQVITFKGQPTLEGFSEFLDVPYKKKSVSLFQLICLCVGLSWCQAFNICTLYVGFPAGALVIKRRQSTTLTGHVSHVNIVRDSRLIFFSLQIPEK